MKKLWTNLLLLVTCLQLIMPVGFAQQQSSFSSFMNTGQQSPLNPYTISSMNSNQSSNIPMEDNWGKAMPFFQLTQFANQNFNYNTSNNYKSTLSSFFASRDPNKDEYRQQSQEDYFPQCKMPRSNQLEVTNVCANGIPVVAANPNDPNSIQAAASAEQSKADVSALIALADKYIIFYKNNLDVAVPRTSDHGIACINQKIYEELAGLNDNLANLNSVATDAENYATNIVKPQLEGIKKEIAAVINDLNGKSRAYGRSCGSAVIPADTFNNGLRGVRDYLNGQGTNGEPLINAARNFGSIEVYESSLNKTGEELRKHLKNIGLESLVGDSEKVNISDYIKPSINFGAGSSGNVGDSLSNVLTRTLNSLGIPQGKTRIEEAASKLVGLGYNESTVSYYLDTKLYSNYSDKLNNRTNGAAKALPNDYMSRCVREGTTEYADPLAQVIAAIRQKDSGRTSTSIAAERCFSEIMGKDGSLEVLIGLNEKSSGCGPEIKTSISTGSACPTNLKVLSACFPDVYISAPGKLDQSLYSPYALYSRYYNGCQYEYNNNKSAKPEVDNTIELLKQFRERSNPETIVNKFTNDARKQFITCEERTLEGMCSSETMNPSNGSFCVRIASNCATSIKGCSTQTANMITEAENKMNNLATEYNRIYENFFRLNQAELQKVAQGVGIKMAMLQKFVKNALAFDYQGEINSIFMELPPKSKYDPNEKIDLYGGIEPLDTKSFSENIKKLMTMFKEQQNKIKTELETYRNIQQSAIEENKGDWENIRDTCIKALNDYNQKVTALDEATAKANAENAKKQQEQQEKSVKDLEEICTRSVMLSRSGKTADCELVKPLLEKIYSNLIIALSLKEETVQQLTKLKADCSLGDSDIGKNTNKDSKPKTIREYCEENQGEREPTLRKVLDKYIVEIRKGDTINKIAIIDRDIRGIGVRKFITMLTENNEESVKNEPYYKNLANARSNDVRKSILLELAEIQDKFIKNEIVFNCSEFNTEFSKRINSGSATDANAKPTDFKFDKSNSSSECDKIEDYSKLTSLEDTQVDNLNFETGAGFSSNGKYIDNCEEAKKATTVSDHCENEMTEQAKKCANNFKKFNKTMQNALEIQNLMKPVEESFIELANLKGLTTANTGETSFELPDICIDYLNQTGRTIKEVTNDDEKNDKTNAGII